MYFLCQCVQIQHRGMLALMGAVDGSVPLLNPSYPPAVTVPPVPATNVVDRATSPQRRQQLSVGNSASRATTAWSDEDDTIAQTSLHEEMISVSSAKQVGRLAKKQKKQRGSMTETLSEMRQLQSHTSQVGNLKCQ